MVFTISVSYSDETGGRLRVVTISIPYGDEKLLIYFMYVKSVGGIYNTFCFR